MKRVESELRVEPIVNKQKKLLFSRHPYFCWNELPKQQNNDIDTTLKYVDFPFDR
jgi:hypothetical protein